MIRLLSSKPEMLALASLAPLKHVAELATQEAKTCGCNATKVYKEHAGTFEVALGQLQHGDHLVMKRLFGLDQICYYVREDGGKLRLKCI